MKKFNVVLLVMFFTFTNLLTAQIVTWYDFEDQDSVSFERFFTATQNILSPIEILISSSEIKAITDKSETSFDIGKITQLDSKNNGFRTNSEDGAGIWSLNIRSKDAKALSISFKEWQLAEGAEIVIYNEAKTMLFGPITSYVAEENPVFRTDFIEGDALTIVLREPKEVKGQSYINISSIGYAFKDPFERSGGFGQSLPCEINVNCPEGAGWGCETNGVALIIIEYQSGDTIAYDFCSGGLLNNTKLDFKPYILTATHCTTKGNPPVWGFRFKYKSPACSPTTNPSNTVYFYGATKKAESDITDPQHTEYLLVQLNTNPDPCTGLTWLGWDRNNYTQINTPTGIHHPRGDVMKISKSDQNAVPAPIYNTQNAYWRVYWQSNKGLTEGGSSGSPLFKTDKKVVGQLRGGFSNCSSTGPDYYGRFTYSWEAAGGGYMGALVKQFLAPISPGTTSMNSTGICYPLEITLNNGSPIGTVTNICANQTYTLEVKNAPWATSFQWTLTVPNSQVVIGPMGNKCDIRANSPTVFNIQVKAIRSVGGNNCEVVRTIGFQAVNCLLGWGYSSYPNPASDYVEIVPWANEAADLEAIKSFDVDILNTIGQTRLQYHQESPSEKATIDISTLPDGVYNVIISNSKGTFPTSLVVKK